MFSPKFGRVCKLRSLHTTSFALKIEHLIFIVKKTLRSLVSSRKLQLPSRKKNSMATKCDLREI